MSKTWWFRVFLAGALLFALLGGVIRPEWSARQWQKLCWDVPVAQTVDYTLEKAIGAVSGRVYIGRGVSADEAHLMLSATPTRKETALADGRVDGRAQYRGFMFFLSILCLILAMFCRPTGPAGPQGIRGLTGLTGSQGPKGPMGPVGPSATSTQIVTSPQGSTEAPAATSGPSTPAEPGATPDPSATSPQGPTDASAAAPAGPTAAPDVQEPAPGPAATDSAVVPDETVDLTLIWTVKRPGLESDVRQLELKTPKLADAQAVTIELKNIRGEGMPADVNVRIS